MRSYVLNGGCNIVSSINSICGITVKFQLPWLLFLLIPAFALMLFPYFRLKKQHRRTASRVISLVLHSVILLLCVFVLCGMQFTVSHRSVKNDVILLVDVSDSNEASREDMNKFIRSVVDETEEGYRLGIITFANGQVYSAKLNSDANAAYKNYLAETQKPEGNASDIASALMYARDQLANPSAGRIILLADGRQTDGNALSAVKILADQGTRVDTVYFSPKPYASEVQITSVEVPQKISVGDTVQISITLQSTGVETANLKLYDNKELYRERDVLLGGGAEIFSFDYALSSAKLHEFRVEVEAEGDTLIQNNVYYAYVNVETSQKVLVVEGTSGEADNVFPILEENFDSVRVSVNEMPTTLDELRQYDEVILMNVANSDLPYGFDDVLTEYVEIYGGGLYTVGGDKAYRQDDMQNTKFQDLLPVEANTEAKSLGLLLMIDRSSSMKEKPSGSSSTRLQLAIDAAVASLDALKPEDYVGVITFDENANTIVDMMSISRKSAIISEIRKISLGYGTQYYKALNTASNMLSSFNKTEMKHIIFLTDGEPVDADKANFMNEIDRMAKTDITLSTIALGASVSTDTVEQMAEHGGGRCYTKFRETELSRIMVEEATVAASQYKNEYKDGFTPTVESHTSALLGIADIDIPALGGFYGTKLKDDAIMVLKQKGNPVYAEWQRGMGRVGSFMCDLNGAWSAEFLADENGRKFITNVVSSLLPKETNQEYEDVRVEYVKDNFSTEVRIAVDVGSGETISAQVTAPDGTVSALSLQVVTEGLYSAVFATERQGIYSVTVTKSCGEELKFSSFTAFSYSAEYDAFADDTECFTFLETVSSNGNGTMLFSAENLFGRQNETVTSNFNPQLTFLIICLVLFLADIVVRKFKIKLPKKNEEKTRTENSAG